jgi:CARDB
MDGLKREHARRDGPFGPAVPERSRWRSGSRIAARPDQRETAVSRRRLILMPSHDRRAAGRRRAWGRGPIILKLESLDRRQLLSAQGMLPDLVNSALITSTGVTDWGNSFEVEGRVKNQGGGTTTAPFQIIIYASPIRGVMRYSVPIGQVTIPAGLAPGAAVPYDTSVTLPSTPIPDVGSTGGTLFVVTAVNPAKTVTESNYHNDVDLGPPYDTVAMLVQPPSPSNLVGTTLAVTNNNVTWGSTITVTAQITNQGSGASPQTRALLSLTPAGLNYGDWTTVGIGSIVIPPLAAFQTINVVQNITLPAVEPVAIANYTNFGLSMVQDADYLTNDLYPHQPDQGLGLDQAAITVTTSPTSTATAGPLPDLAASSVLVSSNSLNWGSTFQASTDVENLGQGPAGPFLVRFLLTGQSGSLTDALYLGDATISGLAAGANQQLTESLQLPGRLPNGVTLSSVGYARIAVIVDPENVVNETLKSNNQSISAPIILRLPGNQTTVPTTAAAGNLPSIETLAQQAQHRARLQATAKLVAKHQAKTAKKKIRRRGGSAQPGVVSKAESLGKEITKLPSQVFNALKKSI